MMKLAQLALLALARLVTLFSMTGFAVEVRKLRKGTSAMKLTRLLIFGTVLLVMCFAYACGLGNPTSGTVWECEVTVTHRPFTGFTGEPSRTRIGRDTGADFLEARRAALKAACSQLNLRDDCENSPGVSSRFDCDSRFALSP